MNQITLTPDQDFVVRSAVNYIKQYDRDGFQFITIGGYAGTGKTSIIRFIKEQFPDKVFHYMSFTGKATMNLAQKLGELDQDTELVSTIHSAIYSPIYHNGKLKGWHFNPEKTNQDIIIVDEASMVTTKMHNDLIKKDVPILYIGDHGQLPPVESRWSKNNLETINLMASPDLRLETIHRNAGPISQLATWVRTNGKDGILKHTTDDVEIFKDVPMSVWERIVGSDSDLVTLVATNNLRVSTNKFVRKHKMQEEGDVPVNGDAIIFLQNDWDHDPVIFNGMIATVTAIKEYDAHNYLMDIYYDGDTHCDIIVAKYAFNKEKPRQPEDVSYKDLGVPADFAYAITCHKAQGSEWDEVIVIGNGFGDYSDRTKWLYTAITRAKKKITLTKQPKLWEIIK